MVSKHFRKFTQYRIKRGFPPLTVKEEGKEAIDMLELKSFKKEFVSVNCHD